MSGLDAILYSLLEFDRANTSWMDEALCAQEDPDIWFPVRWGSERLSKGDTYQDAVDRAIDICLDCPVMLQCRADAESRNEKWGVWGGKDFYTPNNHRARAKAS